MKVLDLRLVPAAVAGWLVAIVLVGQSATTARWCALVVAGLCAVGLGYLGWMAVGRVRERDQSPVTGRRGASTLGRSRAVGTLCDVPRPRSAGQTALMLAVLTCIVVAVSGQLTARERGLVPELLARGAHVVLTGSVVSEPRALTAGMGGEMRYLLTVRAETVSGTVDGQRREGPAHGDALLLGGAELLDVPYGATVRVAGRLRPVDPGTRTAVMLLVDATPSSRAPGAGSAATTATPTAIHVTTPPPPTLRQVNAIREAFVEVCARLPDQARGLVPGIAIGDTSMLSTELDEALRTTGLTHMTAVSGSHFAIIAAATFWLCALVRLPRWGRAVTASIVLTGFVLLVHPEPSVLRAGVMGAVALLAVLLGRQAQAVPALCATVIVLLVVDPFLARSYGFVLSVLATAALVLGVAPLTRRLERWMPFWLALALAVPFAAQLACAPVLVLLDPSVSLYAVPANLLAAPALVSATVLGVLGALCAPWWPEAAGLLAEVAGWSTWWIAEVALTFAAAPGARVPWPGGGGGAALLAALTVAGLVAVTAWPAMLWWVRTRLFVAGLARSPSVPRRTRSLRDAVTGSADLRASWAPVRVAVLVLTVLVAATVVVWTARPPWLAELAGGAPAGPAGWPPDWEVALCDVGQGDAMLVRTGPGRALMIDVGPADGEVGRCLADLAITELDLLVLTHFHADHVGALGEVLAAAHVEQVLVSPVRDPADQAAAVTRALDDAEVPWSVAVAGDGPSVLSSEAGVSWQVLAPASADGASGSFAPESVTGGANDGSVVLALATEHLSVIALGDLETAGQAALLSTLQAAGIGDVDVVKMAHHGSRTQDAALARWLSPDVTLVSSGADNTYGHPAPSALDLYRGVGSAIVRTDTCSTFALVVRDEQTLVAGTCS